jgi:hypothetical protein
MHLKKFKLYVRIPMTIDPLGVTPKVIGPNKYPVCMGRGVSQGETSDTTLKK